MNNDIINSQVWGCISSLIERPREKMRPLTLLEGGAN